jgi:hypothetical protein
LVVHAATEWLAHLFIIFWSLFCPHLQAEELKFQQDTAAELQKEKSRLEGEVTRLGRENVLLVDKEGLYAKQGYRQNKEIKELQNKVKGLERSLSQVCSVFFVNLCQSCCSAA